MQRGEAPGGGGGGGGGLRGDLEREDAELAGLRARRRALEAQLDDFAAAAADEPAAAATGTAPAPRRKAAWKVRQEMRWQREAAVAEAAELRREQEALFYAAPAPIPVAADRRPTPTPKEKDKKKKKKDYAARAFAAIAAGDAAALARLLQRRRVGADVVDAATGDAALAAAATAGHAEVLEVLCDAGADPNRRNPRTGNTVSLRGRGILPAPEDSFPDQAPSPSARPRRRCTAASRRGSSRWRTGSSRAARTTASRTPPASAATTSPRRRKGRWGRVRVTGLCYRLHLATISPAPRIDLHVRRDVP